MMMAFAEILPIGTMLIRVGQNVRAQPDPWDFQVVRMPDGELRGLSRNPDRESKFTVAHMRALKELIEDRLALTWKFERFNHDNERIIDMPKEKIASVSDIFTGGKLNHGKFVSGFSHAMKQINDGHYRIENGSASETPIDGGVRITISFDRLES